MTRSARIYGCATILALLIGSSATAAQPLWKKLVPSKKIDADAKKSYSVTESSGPWMVLATVFHGEDADQKAAQLVYELRKDHKVEAYTHTKVFEHTERTQRGLKPDGTPQYVRPLKYENAKECAVLVGNFSAVDDPAAAEMLQKIKTMDVKTLREADPALAEVRQAAFARRKKGPMGAAFVVANPLLPEGYFNSGGLDKLVLDMNREVPHSLLNNRGKFTVKVGTFAGVSTLDKPLTYFSAAQKENRRGKKSSLQQAGERAHLLCMELRAIGVEAYEYHDRDQSIVTVGSFERVEARGPDGVPRILPEVQAIQQRYRSIANDTPDKMVDRTLPDIELVKQFKKALPKTWSYLDMQPEVVLVPKRSISSDYQQ
ncbi:MAG: hypothetical protein SGJ20_21585 [Planctomycetota bacterium]|nr:hypothetical protein [Planctomycetota bacterium]